MRNVSVWSCGGGRQSAGIAALIVSGVLPKPDIAVIVDTEYEKQSTWDYCDAVLKPELAKVGVDLLRVSKSAFATVDLYRNDDLLIPAFTTQAGQISKMPTFCSNEWKQRVVRRYLRSEGVRDCTVWLGISKNEADRMKDSGLKWLTHAYPLIDLGYGVEDCLKAIRDLGWPDAPRSSCYMCPNQGRVEWEGMSDEDFQKAQAFESEIRKRDPFVYLTRTGKPLTRQVITAATANTLDHCGGHCMT